MLVLVDLFEFEVVVAPELGVASSHRVRGFQQIVAEIAVAGFNHSGMLRFKFTGLIFVPDKAGKLGNGGLRIKPVNVADFSDDAGGVNLANARNGSQGMAAIQLHESAFHYVNWLFIPGYSDKLLIAAQHIQDYVKNLIYPFYSLGIALFEYLYI